MIVFPFFTQVIVIFLLATAFVVGDLLGVEEGEGLSEVNGLEDAVGDGDSLGLSVLEGEGRVISAVLIDGVGVGVWLGVGDGLAATETTPVGRRLKS